MTSQVGLDAYQLRINVARPVLLLLGLWSRPAEEIVLGTAAAESQLRYIRQLGGGPARGIFQMEEATHDDCWDNFLRFRRPLAATIESLLAPGQSKLDQLGSNLAYGVAMCRVRYLRDPEPLPNETDIPAQARLWKRVYNTPKGKGTEKQYVDNYRALIGAAPTGV